MLPRQKEQQKYTIVSAACSLSVFLGLVWSLAMITWQWCKIDCGLTGRLDVPRGLKLPISWPKTGLEFLAVNQAQISTVPIEHYETSTDIYHRYLPQISTNETWNVAAENFRRSTDPPVPDDHLQLVCQVTEDNLTSWKWFIMIHQIWCYLHLISFFNML